jgi:polyhydroxyalkanoate synthase subunit PhaC
VRGNGFCEGTVRLGGADVDLDAITCPVLNIVAERDHIVPIQSAEPILKLVGSSETDELRLPAGHVGLFAGRAATKVTLPAIARWIQDQSDRVRANGD